MGRPRLTAEQREQRRLERNRRSKEYYDANTASILLRQREQKKAKRIASPWIHTYANMKADASRKGALDPLCDEGVVKEMFRRACLTGQRVKFIVPINQGGRLHQDNLELREKGVKA